MRKVKKKKKLLEKFRGNKSPHQMVFICECCAELSIKKIAQERAIKMQT